MGRRKIFGSAKNGILAGSAKIGMAVVGENWVGEKWGRRKMGRRMMVSASALWLSSCKSSAPIQSDSKWSSFASNPPRNSDATKRFVIIFRKKIIIYYWPCLDISNLLKMKINDKQVSEGMQCTTCIETFKLGEEVAMLGCLVCFCLSRNEK